MISTFLESLSDNLYINSGPDVLFTIDRPWYCYQMPLIDTLGILNVVNHETIGRLEEVPQKEVSDRLWSFHYVGTKMELHNFHVI